MKDNDVTLDTRKECLEFRRSGIQVWNKAKPTKAPAKPRVAQVMASTFLALARKNKREARRKHLDPLAMGVYSVSLADIDKALRPKQKGDPNRLLPSQYREALKSFSRELADTLPPHRQGVDHTIELEKDENGNEKPVPWGPLYGMSREELLVLRKTLTELLEKGFIRASNSPAAAPVLFVRKPGGGIRFCVDYRGLNYITRKDRYPLPLIGETLRNVAKSKWFTKLDVIAAFHRIRMAKGEEWKTAFRTRYGLFEWNVMPFGLTGAPAAFQRYLNDVLREYLDDFVSAYVDDILIYSSGSLKDHREKVKKVLRKVQEAGLQLDIDKCEFETQTVKYLGFVITAGKGIEVDPAKIEAIRSWETPTNVKGVRAFLGFANFYRTFIEGFSDKAKPLTRLTSKGTEFYWDDDCEKAFLVLKDALITSPVLVHFDENRETRVDADSSGYATGGVLLQRDDQNRWRPVAFFSQKHSPAEMNYKIYDKELLAIVRCLKAWRAELIMTKFKVMTDHKNLRYFYKERELSERQIRWAEFLSQFNFTLEWRPGKESELPDQLSRRVQDMPKEGSDERLRSRFRKLFQDENLRSFSIATGKIERSRAVDSADEASTTLDFEQEVPIFEDAVMQKAWTAARRTDETYKTISRAVAAGSRNLPTTVTTNTPVSISECSLDKRGLLHFRNRLWIPSSEPLRTGIIQETHDSHLTGHPGRDLTYALVARQFFWPGITNEVRQLLNNCDTCRRTTIWRQSKQGLLKPLPIPERIWSEIHIDFITELPPTGRDKATNLMGITDRLTKGVILEAMDDISAEAVARRLFWCYFPHHGIPTTITSDRGPQFVSDMWTHLCTLMGVKRRLSTAYHPQTDGGQERMNQEIEKMLRIWVTYAQSNWGDLLPVVTTALNNRDATATGISPFFFTHGYHMNPVQLKDDRPAPKKPGQKIAEDFVARIQEASEWAQAAIAWTQDRQEQTANKHKKAAPNYKAGDWVYLDLRNVKTARPSKKLDWLHAKYRVVEQKSSHSYQLDVPGRIHPVFHVDLLRPAAANPLPSQKTEDSREGPVLVDGHEEWRVERILDEKLVGRGKRRSRKLLVKWVSYTTPTWEPVDNLKDTEAFQNWESSPKEVVGIRRRKQQRLKGGGG
jgi:reverse transcriptase-like protein/integrase-like protein